MHQRALSIRQPWAWAILFGGKTVENRPWHASYTGPLLIHASKTHDVKGYRRIQYAVARGRLILPVPLPPLGSLPTGGIVGRVIVTGCLRPAAAERELGDCWWYERGSNAFLIADPEPLPFRAAVGWPGFFDLV